MLVISLSASLLHIWSPVESRLQISDSKLVLIITKYAYVQRNPASGLGAREIWLLDCYGAPLHHCLCLGICPLGRRPRRWLLPARSLNSLTGAPRTRPPSSWLADDGGSTRCRRRFVLTLIRLSGHSEPRRRNCGRMHHASLLRVPAKAQGSKSQGCETWYSPCSVGLCPPLLTAETWCL